MEIIQHLNPSGTKTMCRVQMGEFTRLFRFDVAYSKEEAAHKIFNILQQEELERHAAFMQQLNQLKH